MDALPLRLGLALIFTLALVACDRTPHSSPTALRDTNAYFKATSPPAPRPLDPQALDRVIVTQEGERLVVTYPEPLGGGDENDGFNHAVDRLNAGEKLEGDGARFDLIAFAASGPGISPEPTNRNNYTPLDFFTPDGKPLDKAQLKALGFRDWELTEYVGGSSSDINFAFPKLRLVFGSTRQLPGYYSAVGLFDARTKKSLVSGYSYSQIGSNSLGRMEVHPRAWHATPLEAVVDVELDGKVVVETNVAPELRVAVPGGEVKLLGLWDGGSRSWSSSSGGAGTQATLRMDLRHSDRETNAVALFVTEPPKLAVHVELLDERGRGFEGSGGGTCGAIRMSGIRGQAASVKTVRFTVFTNHHRVVITLPPIPNLPAAGQSVSNLFAVPIPRIQFEREYQLRDVIGEVTQLKFAYPYGGDAMPTNLFPLTLTNVTPAQLVAEYQRHLTNGSTVIVDEAKQEIRVEPTQFEKIKRWVKQKLNF